MVPEPLDVNGKLPLLHGDVSAATAFELCSLKLTTADALLPEDVNKSDKFYKTQNTFFLCFFFSSVFLFLAAADRICFEKGISE